MKAVISNIIYMDCDAFMEQKLDEELTYTIPSYKKNAAPQIIKNMRKINSSVVSIPVGRTDLIPSNYEIKDKRVYSSAYFPEFRFSLRESQQEVHDQLNDNAIINAWVSWGKTFTALAIAKKLQQKTLIITHTIALRNQWEEEVEKVFGVEAGIVGSGKFNIDSFVTVGNTQTLYRNIEQLAKQFGTVIVDEMHHLPAKSFNALVDSNYARYKIGLSGTVERKDGKHVIFRDFFGDKKFTPPRENYIEPTVDVIRSDIRFMDGAHVPWAIRVNDLVQQEEYGQLVSMLTAVYHKKGHKILVLSDRVNFLKRCAQTLGQKCVTITGEDPLEVRQKKIESVVSGENTIIFGTQAIFSEGVSINPLSCLILATPVNNEPLLTQLIGRVVRHSPGKLKPVIVDINLKGKTGARQANLRLGHYLKESYQVQFIDM